MLTFRRPVDIPIDENDLHGRWVAIQEELGEQIGRLLEQVRQHPRYNEKRDRLKRLLSLLEGAIQGARQEIAAEERRSDRTAVLVDMLNRIVRLAQELAEEHVLHPNSTLNRLPPIDYGSNRSVMPLAVDDGDSDIFAER
jgi:hypothetical protein